MDTLSVKRSRCILAHKLAPDVAIVDLNMEPHGGLALLRALLRRLRESGWRGTCLILTVSDFGDEMADALASGARG